MSQVELIVYKKPADNRIANMSPFCAKSEIYLRLNKIDFKINEFLGNPGKFENAKLPVIKHRGKLICDSHFIEEYLNKEFSIDMNKHLSASERAQGFAFTKMLEEYLYWPILIERWLVDENWEKLKTIYFSHMPKLIQWIACPMIRKAVKSSTMGHGIGRHSPEKIHQLGVQGIEALANFLDGKQFLLGDQVSSYDCSVLGFTSNILYSDLAPKLMSAAKKYPHLEQYCQRMNQLMDNQPSDQSSD